MHTAHERVSCTCPNKGPSRTQADSSSSKGISLHPLFLLLPHKGQEEKRKRPSLDFVNPLLQVTLCHRTRKGPPTIHLHQERQKYSQEEQELSHTRKAGIIIHHRFTGPKDPFKIHFFLTLFSKHFFLVLSLADQDLKAC